MKILISTIAAFIMTGITFAVLSSLDDFSRGWFCGLIYAHVYTLTYDLLDLHYDR